MSNGPADPEPDPELIKKRLNLLTARQRLVLRLNLVDGLTQEEVGSRLGIAQSTVSAHRADAFKKLEVLDTPACLAAVKQILKQTPITSKERQILFEHMGEEAESVWGLGDVTVKSEVRVKIYEALLELFDLDDLQDLCFRANVDYDSLSGSTLPGKARSLVAHFEKRGELTSLISRLKQLRPNLDL